MPNFSFTRDIPFASHNPSADQPIMQTNTNSEDSIWAVDHFGFNDNDGGTHQKVSLKNTDLTTTPTLPPNILGAGFETLYSQPAGVAPLGPLGEIFYSRGGNPGIQLTGPGTPQGTTLGSSFLPGGYLINWGQVAAVTDTAVTFTQDYAAAPYVINLTILENSNSAVLAYVKTSSATGFTVACRNASNQDLGLNLMWWAIGK